MMMGLFIWPLLTNLNSAPHPAPKPPLRSTTSSAIHEHNPTLRTPNPKLADAAAVLLAARLFPYGIGFHALRHVTICEGRSAAGEGTCKQRTAVFVRGWEGEPEPPCDHADRAVRDDGSQY